MCWAALTAASADAAQPHNETALTAQINTLTRSFGGAIGLCAIHVQSAWQFGVHADTPFSAASTLKIPMALQFLQRAQADNLDLNALVPLAAGDMRPYGPLATYFPDADLAVTWRQLLRLMIVASDNTATDVILKRAGGPPAVMAMLDGLNVKGMHIDRGVLEFFFDIYGLGPAPPEGNVTLAQLQQLRAKNLPGQAAAADAAFALDPRDRTTPCAMANFLQKMVVGGSYRQRHAPGVGHYARDAPGAHGNSAAASHPSRTQNRHQFTPCLQRRRDH